MNHVCNQRRVKIGDCQASCGLDHIQHQLDGLISNYNGFFSVILDCLEVLKVMQTTDVKEIKKKMADFSDDCNILSQLRSHFQAGNETNCIHDGRDGLKDKHCLINPGDRTTICPRGGHFVRNVGRVTCDVRKY